MMHCRFFNRRTNNSIMRDNAHKTPKPLIKVPVFVLLVINRIINKKISLEKRISHMLAVRFLRIVRVA